MKMKISLFKHTESPNISPSVMEHSDIDDDECWADRSSRYTRIAPPIIVTFDEYPKEDMVSAQVIRLNEMIDTIRAEATAKVEELQQIKRDLLQIEYIPAGEE